MPYYWTALDNYVLEHKNRYLTFLNEVANSPFSPEDKVEFAIISANAPLERCIEGFLATRDRKLSRQELGEKLHMSGVNAPYVKGLYLQAYRDAPIVPEPPYRAFRRDIKIAGLGHCKMSFASCLIDPFNPEVVCIDSNVAKHFGWDAVRLFASLRQYEDAEALLLENAARLEVPPFLYQWAVFDFRRGQMHPHDFLWQSGRQSYQLELL